MLRSLYARRTPHYPWLQYVQSTSRCARDVYLEVLEFVIVSRRHISCVLAFAFRWRVVVIKVTTVCCVFDLWNNRPFDLAVIQGIPIDGFEEWVGFHQSGAAESAAGYVTESLRWIDRTETADEIMSVWWHFLWILDFGFDDANLHISLAIITLG